MFTHKLSRQILTSIRRTLGIGMLLILSAGCSLLGQEEPTPVAQTSIPVVTIDAPIAGQNFPVNQVIIIQSTSLDERAITRVELLVNDEIVRIDSNADPQPKTPFIVAQEWTAGQSGSYKLQVRAFNSANVSGESATVLVNAGDEAPQDVAAVVEAETPTLTATPQPVAPPATETPIPTATVTPLPTDTPTQTPEPTPPPPPTATFTPSPTPIPLPTPTFGPTDFEPEGPFTRAWEQLGGGDGPLGYPSGAVIKDRNFAKQYFAGGVMFWWDNPDGDNPIWVIEQTGSTLQSGDRWYRFVDHWEKGTHSCDAAKQNGEAGPVRGFGKVWCEQADVNAALGKPVEREGGSAGQAPYSQVQFYQGGFMFYNPLNSEVYIFINRGDWRQFGY